MDVGEREAVEVVNETGGSEIVLLCEHASNHIPREYCALGLDASQTRCHIAWDIGAAGLTRLLSRRLDAPAFLGTYSRLLMDLNRPLGSSGSIPVRSEDTDIPGNAGIDAVERERRARTIFTPYHDRVAAHLDRRTRLGRPTRILTIHSFTPVFLGVPRPWHAGVLHGEASGFALLILRGLRADPGLHAEANVPYAVSRDDDYAIPVHGDDRGIPAALIEIRQDLLGTEAAQEAWSVRLAMILGELLAETIP
jgi:predicted N-formylglutamate amidohydrolase